MSDEAKLTQADIDKAVKAAIDTAKAEWDADKETEIAGLKDKNKELLGKVRAAGDIKPEDLAAAEARAEKAEGLLTEANKQVKTLTKERDDAKKSLETEQGAARNYALEAEIAGAIAEGNVVPALVPAFKALISGQAKADLVEGKYAVTIGDKAAKEYVSAYLESDEGKYFKTAANNSGGGAQGGGNGGGGGKTVIRSEFDAMDQGSRASFVKDGGKVVDVAA